MNVKEYFDEKLGGRQDLDGLEACPIDTPVGRDCKEVIDAAELLMTHTKIAYGGHTRTQDHSSWLRMIAKTICDVYYFG